MFFPSSSFFLFSMVNSWRSSTFRLTVTVTPLYFLQQTSSCACCQCFQWMSLQEWCRWSRSGGEKEWINEHEITFLHEGNETQWNWKAHLFCVPLCERCQWDNQWGVVCHKQNYHWSAWCVQLLQPFQYQHRLARSAKPTIPFHLALMNVASTLSIVMSNQVTSGLFSWLFSWHRITLWNHLVWFDVYVDWWKMLWKMFAHHYCESLWLVQINAIIVTLLKWDALNFICTHFPINIFTHHVGRNHLTKWITYLKTATYLPSTISSLSKYSRSCIRLFLAIFDFSGDGIVTDNRGWFIGDCVFWCFW